METFATIIGLLLLWSIARSLKRIVRLIASMKITIDIPIISFNPDPEHTPAERPAARNVIGLDRFRRRA